MLKIKQMNTQGLKFMTRNKNFKNYFATTFIFKIDFFD